MERPEEQFGEYVLETYVCLWISCPINESPALDARTVGSEAVLGKLLGEIVGVLKGA